MYFDIENKKSDTIVFHTHQGFGDLIVCFPIVHYLSHLFPEKRILFVNRDSHKKNIKKFISLNKKIESQSIPGYPAHGEGPVNLEISIVQNWVIKNNYSLIRTGYEKYSYDPKKYWDQSFYEKIGIDYEVKYKFNLIERNLESEDSACKKITGLSLNDNDNIFSFVHDDPDRGISLLPKTDLKIIKNNKDIDIIDMLGIMEKAKELHMMGSSLLCLAELMGLPNNNQKAFYYSVRNNLNFKNKEKWTII